jgi:glycosyltransferase involved in cell wall biosynthesis
MKISVIISTLGRALEVDELLNSMAVLSEYSHEIIVVDQNFNQTLDTIVSKYSQTYNILHYKVDFRSLSKAKNFGIEKAIGEYICFPDDDSRLFADTITNALNILENNSKIDATFGKCVDKSGKDSVIQFEVKPSYLTLKNFEGKFIEATMFARTKLLKENKFDENLGIGSFFGAEEGYDLIYRLLKNGKILYYSPFIRFYHPQVIDNHASVSAYKRVYNYRKGYGYICKKHKLYAKLISRLFLVLCASIAYLVFNYNKSRYYFIEFLAINVGFIMSNENS